MLLLSYDDRLISFRPDDQDRRGVYCVDFKKGSRDVVYAGTDNDLLWLLDLRQRWREGSWISTPGGVRRTFSVSDHQVLAACSEGMHIYDVRALRSSHLNPMQAEIPVVDFPEWYNSSSRPGVAVETDYGVVAASQSEGSPVGLYSLKTGKPLASPMLDAYRPTQRSISALSFSYLWNEDSPSLMFGDGYSICKFSPSRAHDRDEEDDESLWE
ncbi:hypothetical protein GQ53DRAFT_749132 [Thozetella sp. PMI_491]|nr:hypothetical protein GQ53DRAFT_749132 [Thozetella sp. PMI_491]